MVVKPIGIYSSEELAMFSRVLKEALIVSIDGSKLSENAIREMISQLGKLIMDRFSAGETNPEALKRIAIDSLGAAHLAKAQG